MAEIKFGDIIYVKRDCGIFGYKHFGVYSGEKKLSTTRRITKVTIAWTG